MTSSREGSTAAGRSIADFAQAVGISRTTFYMMEEDCKPSLLRVGRRIIVTEAPAAWLERMALRGGVRTVNASA